jgi:hypothetical protein
LADGVVARIEPGEIPEALRDAFAQMTPAERARFRQLMHERRMIAEGRAKRPLTLRQFVDRISGGKFKWYRYAVTLAGVLQDVADGFRKRVMIFAPPRHGKSELVSRYFPAYYLYRHPEQWVALFSHTADLAHTLSRAARSNYFLYYERQSAGAVKQWLTGAGGGLWATGVGGSAVGKGFHLGIIDDPLKSAEEASSDRVRENQREWYRSVFYTRQEPNAAIVIIQQRWHEDDLSGWLLAEEWAEAELADDQQPERWHIVNFEAIKSSPAEIAKELEASNRPSLFPPTCTVEPDWRAPGEALNPERIPAERLERTRRRLGAYYWNALFQQRPRPREGLLFKVDQLSLVADHEIPWQRLRLVRYWDKAASDSTRANFTVGALLGFDDLSGLCYILDLERGQWEPGERNAKTEAATRRDVARFVRGPGDLDRYVVWGEEEPGSGGKDAAAQFRALVRPFAKVFTDKVTGRKTARADGLASATNSGEVRMLRASWNGVLRREFVDFPNGTLDDIVDACSGAYNKLIRRTFSPGDIAPSISRRAG